MKNAPNSKANLDRAIQRYAGDNVRAVELRVSMANAIVAQMIGQGVVKGGSGLKFRYGDRATRVTLDLDTAWRTDLDSFLKDLKAKLMAGWNGFDGTVVVQRQASPKGIPFDKERQAELIKDKLNLKEEDLHRYNNHIDKALEAITNISRCRGMIISHTPPCDCPPPIPVLLPLPERVPDLTPCQKIALWVPFSE